MRQTLLSFAHGTLGTASAALWLSLLTNVRVVDLGEKSDLGRGHGILLGQEKLELERTTCIAGEEKIDTSRSTMHSACGVTAWRASRHYTQVTRKTLRRSKAGANRCLPALCSFPILLVLLSRSLTFKGALRGPRDHDIKVAEIVLVWGGDDARRRICHKPLRLLSAERSSVRRRRNQQMAS